MSDTLDACQGTIKIKDGRPVRPDMKTMQIDLIAVMHSTCHHTKCYVFFEQISHHEPSGTPWIVSYAPYEISWGSQVNCFPWLHVYASNYLGGPFSRIFSIMAGHPQRLPIQRGKTCYPGTHALDVRIPQGQKCPRFGCPSLVLRLENFFSDLHSSQCL